jgi:hypothetical protein
MRLAKRLSAWHGGGFFLKLNRRFRGKPLGRLTIHAPAQHPSKLKKPSSAGQ